MEDQLKFKDATWAHQRTPQHLHACMDAQHPTNKKIFWFQKLGFSSKKTGTQIQPPNPEHH